MRFIRGHNSVGMDRSKPYKPIQYIPEDRGFKSECWIWQLKISAANGYGGIRVDGRDYLAHRWYYMRAKGPIPEGKQIDHLCSVRECVNPDHLEAVTPLRNSRRSRATKLTDAQAEEIYRLTVSGVLSRRKIATAFGVSPGTVAFIAKNGAVGPRNPGQ